jgi:hypothetical protein
VATKSKKIKKETKATEKVSKNFKILKANGNEIYREALSSVEIKAYEAKGWKVEAK